MWTLAYVISRIQPDLSIPHFNTIFWVLLLLVSVSVAIRTESHTSAETHLFSYHLVAPEIVLISRVIFNIIYLGFIASAFYLAMMFLFDGQIAFSLRYVKLILMASFSIGCVLGFTSGIAKHVSGQQTLLSILSIPLLIPVMIICHQVGGNVLMENDLQGGKYLILLGISLVSLALSIVLYPHIWKS